MASTRLRAVCGLVLSCLLSGLASAQSNTRVLYAGEGTTLNGVPVYTSVSFAAGGTVQTSGHEARLSTETAELDLAPNSKLSFNSPAQLSCGMVSARTTGAFTLRAAALIATTLGPANYKVAVSAQSVRLTVENGSVSVNDGARSEFLNAGQSFTGSGDASCTSTSLPDAPSAKLSANAGHPEQEQPAAVSQRRRAREGAAGTRVADGPYWAITSMMFASSVVNAQYAARCTAQPGNCTSIPDPFRSKGAMYGAGIPADLGVSYLTYYLKSKGHRWWFVPAVAITAGNAFLAQHWAGRIR